MDHDKAGEDNRGKPSQPVKLQQQGDRLLTLSANPAPAFQFNVLAFPKTEHEAVKTNEIAERAIELLENALLEIKPAAETGILL